MHAHLLTLLGVPDPKSLAHSAPTSKSPVRLLSLLLQMIPPPADTVLLTLVSTYLMHAIIFFTHIAMSSSSTITTLDSFSIALVESDTLLTWVPYCVSLPCKHIDTTLTRAYTVLTKSCSSISANMRSTFLIRIYVLKCLLCTSPGTVQPNTFWDQIQKLCTVYRLPCQKRRNSPSQRSCQSPLVRSYRWHSSNHRLWRENRLPCSVRRGQALQSV